MEVRNGPLITVTPFGHFPAPGEADFIGDGDIIASERLMSIT